MVDFEKVVDKVSPVDEIAEVATNLFQSAQDYTREAYRNLRDNQNNHTDSQPGSLPNLTIFPTREVTTLAKQFCPDPNAMKNVVKGTVIGGTYALKALEKSTLNTEGLVKRLHESGVLNKTRDK